MLSFGLLLSASAAAIVALVAASTALGQMPACVRGTITAIDDRSISLEDQGGRTLTLNTGAYTTYADLLSSGLDEIKIGDFVGSAVKETAKSMVAVEVALVPEDMRAGRVAYYGWDALPDPTTKHASVKTPTKMTNGLVINISEAVLTKLVDLGITSGSVPVKSGGVGRTLTLAYDGGGKTFRIMVPANAPVVRYKLADRSALNIGAAVMTKTNPGDKAGLISFGKGVVPPV